jgi:NAD-dependent DNA ligase
MTDHEKIKTEIKTLRQEIERHNYLYYTIDRPETAV